MGAMGVMGFYGRYGVPVYSSSGMIKIEKFTEP